MKSPFKVPSLIVTSGAIRATQLQEITAAKLLDKAERLYIARDTTQLARISNEIAQIQHRGAQAASDYYKAILAYRAGEGARAHELFTRAASCQHAPRYQARAIHSIAVESHKAGNHSEAFRIYTEAMKAARAAGDFIAQARVGLVLSEMRSDAGDHTAALEQLRVIRPIFEMVGARAPFYLYLFSNEVAFELSQAGRLEEARRFSMFALASPFARAYPEWRETAQEIEQQAEAKAALNVRPAVDQARSTPIKPKLRLVKKPCPAALPASTRRTTGPVAIIRPEQPRSRPILKQISFKVQIRAPSF